MIAFWNRAFLGRCFAIMAPAIAMAGTLAFFYDTASKVAVRANVLPLDSYYYQSFASNIQKGNGPRTDWPQGPQNKYFPGYAYWWALFLPHDMHPDDALRHYAPAHVVLLGFTMVGLAVLGWRLWKDWVIALCFAAIGSATPILLKWGFVPLSELMASACLSGIAAGFACFFRKQQREAGILQLTGETGKVACPTEEAGKNGCSFGSCLLLLLLFGAIGFLTRLEVGYFLGVLVGVLFLMKRMRWTTAAIIGMCAMMPVALWQMWAARTFHEASYYVGEGSNAFQFGIYLNHFFYQMLNFLKVQEVVGTNALVGVGMLLADLLFLCALVIALRGYSGRMIAIFAWMILGYWLLHAFWYYRTERYNLLIVPFGMAVFVEGLGRIYHMGKGWFARGGRIALPLLTLVLVPVFWVHASDNIWTMVAVFNQQKRFPENRKAILGALASDLRPNETPVFVTTISLPEARRLPGIVYFDDVFSKDPCSNLLPPLYPPGKAQEFIRENRVTHLALKPPIDEWMVKNGQGLDVTPIYNDRMVWIGRIER